MIRNKLKGDEIFRGIGMKGNFHGKMFFIKNGCSGKSFSCGE
jgi:hypothetical protein